ISVAGESLTGTHLRAEGGGLLRIGDHLHRYFAASGSGTVDVWLDGETYHFALPAAAEQKRGAVGQGALSPGGIVEAPMPGRVLQLLRQPGDRVERGDPLAVM